MRPAAQKNVPGPAIEPADAGWRISPEKINIQAGDDRTLQALDDRAQELHDAVWSVDDPSRAELQDEEHGRVVVHAKSVGTLRVSAVIGDERRVRDITIWPADNPLPDGTTSWAVHPIGAELGDLPAVPTDDGPNMFSLEQTADGTTYLRAGRDDGIQVWTWMMGDEARDVELVCGDWLGGAMISVNRPDSYTLFAIGKDGRLRWQYRVPGLRKGLTIGTDNVVHLLSQSPDRVVANVIALDDVTGAKLFEIPLPRSVDKQINVRQAGKTFACTFGTVAVDAPIAVSRLFVNIDGFAYVAFTETAVTVGTAACTPGSAVPPADMYVARNENLVLWQIHPDGTYRTTIVEAVNGDQPFLSPANTVAPTPSLVPDNMDGVLIPVRASHRASWGSAETSDEFVYRVSPDGDEIVYKLPLPKYSGVLHDEMVIGENDLAFATRGGLLIAFNVRTGKELWRWDSHTPEIQVFAALANGHCAVQTPTALVEVEDSDTSKELVKGKAMMDWLGHMYIKHN